jgi:hypothetical protein
MSDAIRCGQCRWWLHVVELGGAAVGECELNPPIYIGGEIHLTVSWRQPVTMRIHGCSHGERRPVETVGRPVNTIPAIVPIERDLADRIVVSVQPEPKPCQ